MLDKVNKKMRNRKFRRVVLSAGFIMELKVSVLHGLYLD